MTTMTLSSKNQIVIPKEARQKMGLKGGDKLIVSKITKNEIIIKKTPSFKELMGTIKPNGRDAVEEIRELRDNWRNS